MEELVSHILFVGKGIFLTLELLAGGVSLGLALGILFSILRYKGVMVGALNRLISICRGTPLLLQLSFVYFVVPGVIGTKLDVITAGVLTFGLNSSAYIAEIFRAGIESLPPGQFEAAKTLQIPSFYLWKDIILPQVISNVLPAIINEVIDLLKETALIATIGGMDLMRKAQTLGAEQFTYFLPLCIAGGYYYGLVLLIEILGKRVERRGYHVKAS